MEWGRNRAVDMKNASNAETYGTYANRNIMVGMCAHIVPKGEEMKKRRKLNFWELLPKITPWIMAIWALKYSTLNTEQTIILIVACLTFYFSLQALVEDFRKD